MFSKRVSGCITKAGGKPAEVRLSRLHLVRFVELDDVIAADLVDAR